MKKGWLFVTTIFVFLLLIINPYAENIAFIPDLLNLEQLKPKEYFGLIIGAIASIFGILMAVVLLTIEFFKERLNNNQHINPLDNELVRNSIYNSINLIGLSFIAYIFVDSFNNSKNLTIGYFIGLIFLAYIYAVYPVLKRMIAKSSRIKGNIDLASTITLDSFQSVSRYKYRLQNKPDGKLTTLQKEIDSYLLSNNLSAYKKINDDIISNAIILIADGNNRDACDIVINGLTWLWSENCRTAIRVNDTQYFELLWDYIEKIYLYFSQQQAPLLHLQDLDYFIKFVFLELHVALGSGLPLTKALDKIENSFKANLANNCPSQENLKELIRSYEGGKFVETGFEDSSQWDKIKEILGIFSYIEKTAINLSDKSLFESSIRKHQDVCKDLFYFDFKLGNYQKGNIFWNAMTSSSYSSSLALEQGLFSDTKDCFQIPTYFIDRIIEGNEVDERDVRVVISHLADYLIIAFENNKLSTDQLIGTLHEFCMIGINVLKVYNTNNTAMKTVKYIIKILKHLKKTAEKDLSKVNPKDYLAIKKKVNHFIKVAVDMYEFKENEKPVKGWLEIYNDFKKVSEKKDFGIVKW